jgi:hypothetical protein
MRAKELATMADWGLETMRTGMVLGLNHPDMVRVEVIKRSDKVSQRQEKKVPGLGAPDSGSDCAA